MTLAKPTLKRIKSLATEQSFERGTKYFEGKRVISASISQDMIIGLVSGRREYAIRVSGYTESGCHCTCPYYYEGVCKHIVATLLHTSKHFKQMKKDETDNINAVNKLFSDISAEKLKEFMKILMRKNSDIEVKFIEYFEKDYDIKQRNFEAEIDSLYRNAGGKYNIIEYGNEIDFGRFNKIAKIKEKNGAYHSAYEVYKSISEGIARNMDYVDDSDDHYGQSFSNAIVDMVSCISKLKPSHKEKRQYMSYLLEKYVEGEPDYFMDDYEAALGHICTNDDDHEYWKKILEPHIPKQIPNKDFNKQFMAERIIMMQIRMLKRLQDKSIQDVYAAHYADSEEVCLSYIDYLKKNKSKQLPQIIQNGLKCHPESRRIKEFASSTHTRKTHDTASLP